MTSLFNQPSSYMGNTYYFLKDEIPYTTIKPVILRKTKFSYHIQNLSNDDTTISYHIQNLSNDDTIALNNLLKGIYEGLKIEKRNFYLKSKEIILDKDETKGFIDIRLQGYKLSPTKPDPIPIIKLYDVDYTNADVEVDDTLKIKVGTKWQNKPLL